MTGGLKFVEDMKSNHYIHSDGLQYSTYMIYFIYITKTSKTSIAERVILDQTFGVHKYNQIRVINH